MIATARFFLIALFITIGATVSGQIAVCNHPQRKHMAAITTIVVANVVYILAVAPWL